MNITLTDEEAQIVVIWLEFAADTIRTNALSENSQQRAAEVEFIAERFKKNG